MMKKYSIFLLIILFGVAVYFGGAYITSKFIESRGTVAEPGYGAETKQTREIATGQENELTISDSQGAVAIDTTLLPEESSLEGLVFEVVMNTHSINLTEYDLTKISTLSFGSGAGAGENFTWEPVNSDPHHLKGYLKWSGAVSKDISSFQLEIKGIDDIPSRKFLWEDKTVIDQIIGK